MAMQVMLHRHHHIALAVLAHVFVQRVFDETQHCPRSCLQVTPTLPRHALLAAADNLSAGRAWQAAEGSKAAWQARLPEEPNKWLEWLVALPQKELDLLAFCAASTLSASPDPDSSHDSDAIAKAMGLDIADWWEPTAQGYCRMSRRRSSSKHWVRSGPRSRAIVSPR